jgi:scyllo-inositol 2-dehydrogenase (NADP+)
MEKILNIGIVGCGGMGSGHAIALQSGTGNALWKVKTDDVPKFPGALTTDISKHLRLRGIFDIKPERRQWAQERKIPVYESYDAMLADPDIDAVLVATPNHLHKEQSIAAMRAGKHVLCEKPVMITSEDLEEVMQVSRETGRVFYPRQNREWDEDYLIIKKIYDDKLVGNVFNIKSRLTGSRGIPGDWRGIKEYGGGMMLDWGVHLIDRILQMIPEKVIKLFCSCTYITNKECEDGFQLHMTFESGLTVDIEVGTCHFISEPMWCIYGDRGSAVIHNFQLDGKMIRLTSWVDKDAEPIAAGAGLTKTMAPRSVGESVEERPLPRFDFDRNTLYRNFAEVCTGTAKQIVTQEHALRVLRLMEACFRSNESGEAVLFEG